MHGLAQQTNQCNEPQVVTSAGVTFLFQSGSEAGGKETKRDGEHQRVRTPGMLTLELPGTAGAVTPRVPERQDAGGIETESVRA